ncbi:unnamed protein product [Plutella xylostella]|uniref:(diamondback moth) hypothetical protein n=1 Tax=Plutella xylostella TaxID=51655 RepID=A0A8S4G4U3_PLUXY|nr:unnamed protein product [Plutella xylostella]
MTQWLAERGGGDITYLGRVMAKLPLDVRVSKLIMLGHIFGCLEDTVIMADGDITYLGRVMARLPLDVRVSKLIMLGHIFGCLEDTVIMGERGDSRRCG